MQNLTEENDLRSILRAANAAAGVLMYWDEIDGLTFISVASDKKNHLSCDRIRAEIIKNAGLIWDSELIKRTVKTLQTIDQKVTIKICS